MPAELVVGGGGGGGGNQLSCKGDSARVSGPCIL